MRLILTILGLAVIGAGCRSSTYHTPPPCPVDQAAAPDRADSASPRAMLTYARHLGYLPINRSNSNHLPELSPILFYVPLVHLDDPTAEKTSASVVYDAEGEIERLSVHLPPSPLASRTEWSGNTGVLSNPHAYSVREFEHTATPTLGPNLPVEFSIHAHEAQLGIVEEGDANALVLTDAAEASVQMSVLITDLQEMLFRGFAHDATRAGLAIRELHLELSTPRDNLLAGDVTIRGHWLLLPVHLHLTSTMEITDGVNGRLQRIEVTGKDIGGRLMAGVIDRRIQRKSGATIQLLGLAGGQMQLKFSRMDLDTRLTLLATAHKK